MYDTNNIEDVKKWLRNTVSDLFMDFLYYDRKNTNDGFTIEKVRDLMDKGIISKKMMLKEFKRRINIEYS
jgi:hypothetical protein